MSAELLPCPCCGGDAKFAPFGLHVYCMKCGIQTPECLNKEKTTETWNRRAQQPSAQEAVGHIDAGEDGVFVELYHDRDLRVGAKLYPAPTLRPVSDEDVALARQASDFVYISRGASYETDDAAIRAALESFLARRMGEKS